jgi:hypothetical protein
MTPLCTVLLQFVCTLMWSNISHAFYNKSFLGFLQNLSASLPYSSPGLYIPKYEIVLL